MKARVIAWFSGGIASAVACKWALDTFRHVEIVMTDTRNESDDTYRFLKDCERYFDVPILQIWNPKYERIQDVWRRFLSLNVATGAICSTELKREMRESFQQPDTDLAQVFGFDNTEKKRHRNMCRNYPEINAISPLVDGNVSKEDCARIIRGWGIELPEAYLKGFRNNNCRKTGCVQGGIGYWQKIQMEEPEIFDTMADMEHELTNKKGQPVTINKDQSKDAKESEIELVFLKPHPDYPQHKDISMMKGRPVEPLVECIGFCQTIDSI